MIEVLTTQEFDRWLRRLKDRQGRLRILSRLDRLATGNLGDIKPVGDGVLELRLTFGPGYRIYLTKRDGQIVLLLCGGDRSSQAADIVRARQLAARWNLEGGQR
ncbi:type II toxin-antitoxin system RelE/ParE family toxin [Acidipropionibacterium timonense]|uniref:type II toxin-antitoxin system RelE/ParE family toxin n=1 Tax=Acidipropionibacterium timonense TaxID=2161818 RepID=UPI0010325102|nr:type II toxin-antitoxin system RelE/ParE family toxin [Acidipropionibacterium timonense]